MSGGYILRSAWSGGFLAVGVLDCVAFAPKLGLIYVDLHTLPTTAARTSSLAPKRKLQYDPVFHHFIKFSSRMINENAKEKS